MFCMQFLRHAMSTSTLSLKFFVYAQSEQRDQRMRQVVAYKRLLKQKKIKKLSGTKSALIYLSKCECQQYALSSDIFTCFFK